MSIDGRIERQRIAALVVDVKIALIFLTRLPLRHAGAITGEDLARASWANPIAGALIGASGALVYLIAYSIGLPPLLSALLAVAATILITGALHEDGLGDVADGFGGAFEREKKLAIMRDSRIGTYAGLALILSVAIRAAALTAIAEPPWRRRSSPRMRARAPRSRASCAASPWPRRKALPPMPASRPERASPRRSFWGCW
jgi:cobalamin synthase